MLIARGPEDRENTVSYTGLAIGVCIARTNCVHEKRDSVGPTKRTTFDRQTEGAEECIYRRVFFPVNTNNICSLGRTADDVVGEDVVAASHGEPDAVLVVLEGVVGHVGVERLHHGQSSVAVVVDVVTWNEGEGGYR